MLRLLQISDSHLFEKPGEGKLIGMNTEDSLLRVLELIKQNECQPSSADSGSAVGAAGQGVTDDACFELVLATGDISQDGSIESYQRFHRYMEAFSRPIYYLPGNHDTLGALQSVAPKSSVAPCVIERGEWAIIMLDSAILGQASGRFSDEQLAFLEKSLTDAVQKHVAICLHHHPTPMDCQWLDSVGLLEPELFLAIVDRFSNIRAVIHGHVHQESKRVRDGVPYYSLPSTCIQFKPKNDEFQVDTVAPGYRWFEFYPDGSIKTAVHRVDHFYFEIDQSVTGY